MVKKVEVLCLSGNQFQHVTGMVKKVEMPCFNRNQFQHTDMLKEVEMLLARLFNDFFSLSIKSCFTIIFRSGVAEEDLPCVC